MESNKLEGSADAVEAGWVLNNLVSWWRIKLALLKVCNIELTISMPSLEEGKRLTNDW